MTAKRDLKRRVRQRQARTGEAYVTARRHVVATKADGDGDAEEGVATGGEAVDASSTTGRGLAAEPTDAATAIPAAGALRVATDAAPAPDTAPSVTAGPVPAEAVAAEIDAGDTGPVRAAASADPAAPTPAAPDRGKPAGAAVPVVELLDVTEQARRKGLVCRVAMFQALAARVEPASVLAQLRDLLIETAGDPQFRLLAQVALTGNAPPRPQRPLSVPSFESVQRFFRRARAGLGGVSEDGTTLAFHVAGRDGLVPVGCALHWSETSLVLSGIDDLMFEVAGLRDWLTAEDRAGAGRQVTDLLMMRLAPGPFAPGPVAPAPMLFVIHDGRRYPITRDEFLIGRNSRDAHLAIKDGMVSRHHAAVICRGGVHYLKDLGSTHGIYYKGMQIDNKRIDEGDVFQIGDHSLQFTYHSDDGL